MREWSRLAKPAKRTKSSRSASAASRGDKPSMALDKLNSCTTPWLGRRYGRSIVPNRSEPRATAASKTKQPNSRKTPTLARRAEPLGTMALHCMTPPLGRRNGRSIVPNRSEPRATAASKTKQPNSRKTPPLRVGRSHWGQWLYTVRHRGLGVVMVDRLSPIDRNLEPP